MSKALVEGPVASKTTTVANNSTPLIINSNSNVETGTKYSNTRVATTGIKNSNNSTPSKLDSDTDAKSSWSSTQKRELVDDMIKTSSTTATEERTGNRTSMTERQRKTAVVKKVLLLFYVKSYIFLNIRSDRKTGDLEKKSKFLCFYLEFWKIQSFLLM